MAINAMCVCRQCMCNIRLQGAVPIKSVSQKVKTLEFKTPGFFVFIKVKMTDNMIEHECGCDCDAIPDFDLEFQGELSPEDFNRLIKSKLQRAELYSKIMDHWRKMTK